jgi:hypothetical protein
MSSHRKTVIDLCREVVDLCDGDFESFSSKTSGHRATKKRKLPSLSQDERLVLQLQEQENEKVDLQIAQDARYAGVLAEGGENKKPASASSSSSSHSSAFVSFSQDERLAQQLQEQERQGQGRTRAPTRDEVLNRLSRCQRAAVDHVMQKAMDAHNAALPQLQARLQSLGYKDTVLEETLTYIREDAPLIIHLKAETLSLLVRDTHYRNHFETNPHSRGASHNTSRSAWENQLFGGAYDKASPQVGLRYRGFSLLRTSDKQLLQPTNLLFPCFMLRPGTTKVRLS